jgi:Spy/CpxP family protein refolding chaperone
MKNKTLAILLLVTFLSMSFGTFAMARDQAPSSAAAMSSPPGDNGGNGEPQGDRMKKDGKNLGLTDSQKQQMKSLRDKRKAERVQQMSQLDSRIRGVLTPDQQTQFDLNKSRMMSSAKDRKACGTTPPAEMKSEKITPGGGEQVQGGKSYGHKGHGKMKALFTNITLTDAQKKQIDTIKEGQKSKMLAMRTEREKDLKRILTPEQFQKFQEMKQNKGKHGGQKGCPQDGKEGGKSRHHRDSPSEKS